MGTPATNGDDVEVEGAAPTDPVVRRARVPADAPASAAAAIARALSIGDATWASCGGRPALTLVFPSHHLDADAFAGELDRALGGVPWIGCTSCGQIGWTAAAPDVGTVAAIAIGSPRLRVGLGLATELARSALRASRAAVVDAASALGHTPEQLVPGRHVAVTLVDGRSGFEESFCLGSAATAPQIRFVGGSASDDVEGPPRARVFLGGRAHASAGLVAILETDLPFAAIESEHMVPTGARVVVTAADPERRRILELDGRPAAPRYAELIAQHGGGPLDAIVASSFPFALYVGGRPYVRSVAGIDGDALIVASAVDPGAILRLMQPGDLVGATADALAAAQQQVGGDLRAVIAFSCLGRHRESTTAGTASALAELYAAAPLVGFHSLGEQAGPLLVNHTLMGLALGGARG